MSIKKKMAVILIVFIMLISNFYIWNYQEPIDENISISITFQGKSIFSPQVYYLTKGQKYKDGFLANQVKTATYTAKGKKQALTFNMPDNPSYIRIDLGDTKQTMQLSDVRLLYNDKTISTVHIDLSNLQAKQMIQSVTAEKNGWKVTTKDGDPYLVVKVDSQKVLAFIAQTEKAKNTAKHAAMCAFVDFILLMAWLKWDDFTKIPKELESSKKLIFNLAKNDFKSRFSGSYLGIVWAFVNPIVTVLLYWFVFQKALNVGTQSTKAGITVPYVLWLIAGLVPWFYFSEAWSSGTNSLIEYSYLVKKVVFKISALPVVKVVSSLFVHLFFIGFTIVLYMIMGFFPSVYTIQIFYYSFCMILFCLGLTYITGAIVVFFRDLSQIIGILMQVLMWMTPIMWNIDGMTINPVIEAILKLNPMYYIVAGYRDSLINKVWFWDRLDLTVYFWIVTILLLGVGTTVFRKLQVHFADVL